MTDEDTLDALFDAGAAAVRFNNPMGDARAGSIVEFVASGRPAAIVDLGCGRGALAHLVAERCPTASVVGVDTDSIALAAAAADAAGRTSFVVGDAATWSGPVDAACCIGASHAFGDAAAMFRRMAELVGAGAAVVGDTVWAQTPDAWCVETFGALPWPDELAELAEGAGWQVEMLDMSTEEEWDEFESAWTEGVRAVGTAAAAAFADERRDEYARYRGVLGFAWLYLTIG